MGMAPGGPMGMAPPGPLGMQPQGQMEAAAFLTTSAAVLHSVALRFRRSLMLPRAARSTICFMQIVIVDVVKQCERRTHIYMLHTKYTRACFFSVC